MQKEAIINAYLSSPNDDSDMGGLGDGRRRMGEAAEYAAADNGNLNVVTWASSLHRYCQLENIIFHSPVVFVL